MSQVSIGKSRRFAQIRNSQSFQRLQESETQSPARGGTKQCVVFIREFWWQKVIGLDLLHCESVQAFEWCTITDSVEPSCVIWHKSQIGLAKNEEKHAAALLAKDPVKHFI